MFGGIRAQAQSRTKHHTGSHGRRKRLEAVLWRSLELSVPSGNAHVRKVLIRSIHQTGVMHGYLCADMRARHNSRLYRRMACRWQNVNEMVITPAFIRPGWKDFNSLMNMHANLLIKLIILLKIHLSSKDSPAMILTCFCH